MVLWRVHEGKATAVKQWAIPLPHAKSAPQSEAAGSAYAVKVLADCLADHPSETYDFYLIQGDNLAVVNSWTGRGTLKQTAMHDLLEEAHRITRYLLVNIEWEYIPRDINKHADYLAGIASQLVKVTNGQYLQHALAPSEEVAPFTYDQDSWQNHAITALRQGHKHVTLIEQADDIAPFAGNLMARLPTKCDRLTTILAYQRRQGHTTPYPIVSHTNNDEGQGRSYAWAPHAGFNASKAIRTLMVGRTQIELDVVGTTSHLRSLFHPSWRPHSIGKQS